MGLLKEIEEQIKLEKGTYKTRAEFSYKFHKERYTKDLKLVKKTLKTGKILELGAAPFHETFLIHKSGYDITAVDYNPQRYGEFVKRNKLRTVKADIEKERLPFKDETFDLVIMNEVIEHLTNPLHPLLEANRVLKKNGKILLTTPNLYYFSRVIKYLMGRGALDPAYREFAKKYSLATLGHVREYTRAELKEMLENTNYKIIKTLYRSDMSRPNIKRMIISTITSLLPFLKPYQVFIAQKDNRIKECVKKLKTPPSMPKID